MKRFGLTWCFILALLMVRPSTSLAQGKRIPLSLRAAVTQKLGTDAVITIDYSRPGVKGRKIWGGLVPYGMNPGNQYSKNKPFPWRAGADLNTTIEFNKDVLIEGKPLPAGKYGLHMIPGEKEWIIIFSKKNDAWGSFTYDQADDALRVTVTPVTAPHEEWLMFGFDNLAGTSATAFLHWEQLRVPFKIALAH
jgi:hypothetical protein